MSEDSVKPKKPLLARIISLETAMAVFGVYSLYTGLMVTHGEEAVTQIFWGVMILCGLCILTAVRRRDWKRHWAVMEASAAAQSGSATQESDGTPQTEK